jgi:hypothetical protein
MGVRRFLQWVIQVGVRFSCVAGYRVTRQFRAVVSCALPFCVVACVSLCLSTPVTSLPARLRLVAFQFRFSAVPFVRFRVCIPFQFARYFPVLGCVMLSGSAHFPLRLLDLDFRSR